MSVASPASVFYRFSAQPLKLLKSSCSQVLAASWLSCSTFISTAILIPRLLVLGQRPRHALYLLCCHLAIGPSRLVGEDVMIRQMPETAGGAVIRLDNVGHDIRGPQDNGQPLHLVDQNQRLQVCHQEILFLLDIFRHRDRLFSKDRTCLCLHKGTNHREPRCQQDIHGLVHLGSSFVRGRSKFLKLLLHQNPRRHLSPDLQEIHGLHKTKVLEDQQCQRLRHSRKLLMSFWTIC